MWINNVLPARGTLRFAMLAAVSLAGLIYHEALHAQQAAAPDLTSLARDVQQLKVQQQQILDSLNDLKKMVVRGNVPQAPTLKLPETISTQGDIFRGTATAQVAIIEFGDFECPYCRRYEQETYPQIADTYIKTGKVRYYYKDLPLPFHAHARPAALAARCAGEQGKYWQMYDALFTDQVPATAADLDTRAKAAGVDTTKLDTCIASDRFSSSIRQNIDQAAKMAMSGTPTFLIGTVAPDGNLVNVKQSVVGAQPFSVFRADIDSLLMPAKATLGEPTAARPNQSSGGVKIF